MMSQGGYNRFRPDGDKRPEAGVSAKFEPDEVFDYYDLPLLVVCRIEPYGQMLAYLVDGGSPLKYAAAHINSQTLAEFKSGRNSKYSLQRIFEVSLKVILISVGQDWGITDVADVSENQLRELLPRDDYYLS